MEVIARLHDRGAPHLHTSMIRHYVGPKGVVIFDHRHNAAMRYSILGA
jgi:hypothetical protein